MKNYLTAVVYFLDLNGQDCAEGYKYTQKQPPVRQEKGYSCALMQQQGGTRCRVAGR
jgi:hypothetical protein